MLSISLVLAQYYFWKYINIFFPSISFQIHYSLTIICISSNGVFCIKEPFLSKIIMLQGTEKICKSNSRNMLKGARHYWSETKLMCTWLFYYLPMLLLLDATPSSWFLEVEHGELGSSFVAIVATSIKSHLLHLALLL